jgi:hypothetical protein
LLPEVRALAIRLNVSLVKASGNADGPVHVLAMPGEALRLGIPLRGSAQTRGRYRIYNAGEFKCAWIEIDAARQDASALIAEFVQFVKASGYQPTGAYRLRLSQGDSATVELQLEIE